VARVISNMIRVRPLGRTRYGGDSRRGRSPGTICGARSEVMQTARSGPANYLVTPTERSPNATTGESPSWSGHCGKSARQHPSKGKKVLHKPHRQLRNPRCSTSSRAGIRCRGPQKQLRAHRMAAGFNASTLWIDRYAIDGRSLRHAPSVIVNAHEILYLWRWCDWRLCRR
jgi:hypothetical protein